VTNDKKQPGLSVVEVDQAFPVLTTESVSRSTATGTSGDQGPAVSAAIRDVLGWRPRAQDPKAFTAALSASFELSTVEDHVIARYVPRGVAVQADLGAVTGGQASLYLRAKAAHEQITRMLDSLKPLPPTPTRRTARRTAVSSETPSVESSWSWAARAGRGFRWWTRPSLC